MASLNKKHGFVLIVVLAILAMLTLVGLAFVSVSRMDRDVSRNYLDEQRAKFLAESGVHHAMAQIKRIMMQPGGFANPEAKAMTYWGNNNSETGTPDSTYPLKDATNPSFAYEDESPQNWIDATVTPKQISIRGQARGFSGFVEQSIYGDYGDIYSIKVVDVSGQLYINEGIYGTVTHPYNTAVMKRILNNLGDQMSPVIATLGTRIMASRPASGYRDKTDLLNSGVLTQAEYDQVKNYIAVHAWLDSKVANPVPLSNDAGVQASYPAELYLTRPQNGGVAITRMGRGKTYTGGVNPISAVKFYETGVTVPEASVFGVDELNPQYIEMTSRAPVNINSASRSVFVALLMDLHGFFVLEQKRGFHYRLYQPSGSAQPLYFSGIHEYQYGGAVNTRRNDGEIGVLFKTQPINSTTAGLIADAILASRPFTTWAQFEAFADGLVGTTLVDSRTWNNFAVYGDDFMVGGVTSAFGSGWSPHVSSDVYKALANQAIADVIKSNFNPNLHLNEINPNANLWRLVDKTDLIVNSTELCFNSHGVIEIESVGRVLNPIGSKSAWTATDNETVAEKTVSVVVKLFDAYRETSQADFYNGAYSGNVSDTPTHNNYALTSAPEVDNGPAAYANTWEGYIHLSLYGGSFTDVGTTYKPKYDPGQASNSADNLWRTPAVTTADCIMGSLMHSHLDLDFNLHHAVSGTTTVLTENYTTLWNWQDPPVTSGNDTSPYSAVYDPDVYRIAYPYKWTGTVPVRTKFAPSDLRVDGAYSERHSALVYSSQGGNFNSARGMMSYWIKPNFSPEMSGKVRIFGNIMRYNSYASINSISVHNPSPFTHYLFHAQWRSPSSGVWAINDSVTTLHCRNNNEIPDARSCGGGCYGGFCPGPGGSPPCCGCFGSYYYYTCPYMYAPLERANPASMGFGFGFTTTAGYSDGIEGGIITRSLNHKYHGHPLADARHETKLKEQWVRANRWTHVALVWDVNPAGAAETFATTLGVWKIYINGVDHGAIADANLRARVIVHNAAGMLAPIIAQDFTTDASGGMNPLRFGEHSRAKGGNATYGYYQNFSSDSTFDEIYVFGDTPQLNATLASDLSSKLWGRGRYYRWGEAMGGSAPNYVSKSINLNTVDINRLLPAPSTITPPGGETLPVSSVTLAPVLLGMSWTAYTSGVYNYYPAGTEPTLLNPTITVSVSMNDGAAWTYGTTSGAWYNINALTPSNIKYRVSIDCGLAFPLSAILLETPVFDDITFYYMKATPEYLSWVVY